MAQEPKGLRGGVERMVLKTESGEDLTDEFSFSPGLSVVCLTLKPLPDSNKKTKKAATSKEHKPVMKLSREASSSASASASTTTAVRRASPDAPHACGPDMSSAQRAKLVPTKVVAIEMMPNNTVVLTFNDKAACKQSFKSLAVDVAGFTKSEVDACAGDHKKWVKEQLALLTAQLSDDSDDGADDNDQAVESEDVDEEGDEELLHLPWFICLFSSALERCPSLVCATGVVIACSRHAAASAKARRRRGEEQDDQEVGPWSGSADGHGIGKYACVGTSNLRRISSAIAAPLASPPSRPVRVLLRAQCDLPAAYGAPTQRSSIRCTRRAKCRGLAQACLNLRNLKRCLGGSPRTTAELGGSPHTTAEAGGGRWWKPRATAEVGGDR